MFWSICKFTLDFAFWIHVIESLFDQFEMKLCVCVSVKHFLFDNNEYEKENLLFSSFSI